MIRHFGTGLLLTLCSSIGPLCAEEYIVDAAGGPGADFVNLQAAVDAAAPGDTLTLRPGTYPTVELTKGLSIVGPTGGELQLSSDWVSLESVLVRWIPEGQVVAIANATFGVLELSNCDGTVVLDTLRFSVFSFPFVYPAVFPGTSYLRVNDCSDVRAHRVHVNYGVRNGSSVRVIDSRLEFVGGSLRGRGGAWGDCANGEDGDPALIALRDSRVHLAAATVDGGDGGDSTGFGNPLCYRYAGNGAYAVVTGFAANELGTTILVSGLATDRVRGGAQGYGEECIYDGLPGDGIAVTKGLVRASGAVVSGGPNFCAPPGQAFDLAAGVALLQPVPPDPIIELVGTPTSGSTVTVRIHGTPGEVCVLWYGLRPFVGSGASGEVEALTSQTRGLLVGSVPPSGSLDVPFDMRVGWTRGRTIFLQAETTPMISPLAPRVRSHSLPIVVR